ncbi:protease modulator HflC [Desulfobotulus pelophilus]
MKGVLGAVLVAALLLAYSAAFVVDETEQAVVTQFGRIVGDPIIEPGLKFKVPFVQMVTFFPKNLQAWDGDPGQIPTLDKTYIYVDAFARWRIVDPVKFFQSIGAFSLARGRLDEIIDPAIRNLVTSNALVESVRWTNREMDPWVELDAFGEVETIEEERDREAFARDDSRTREIRVGREKITEQILAQAQPRLDVFGIELVDVKIKRINYVEQVRESVYKRMIAERRQIAEKYRSEGVGEARKIRGDKERELQRIESEAYRTAQKIRGEADAKVVKLLGDTYGVDPEFYTYQQTLETYREALEGSTVVFSTDSDFMKFINRQGVKKR